ncbi:MAG: primosomal protein N' [Chlamydiales bacterium]|nr:primosomal protein N' [Chlamydiales bacterium]
MEHPQVFSKYASIILDVAVEKALDYGIPDSLEIKRGMQVRVPVRGRLQTGYVIEIKEESPYPKILPIHAVLSQDELLTEELFELAVWMSKYYCTSLQQVLRRILPASIRQNISHKQQYCVSRLSSKEKIRTLCRELRERHPKQAEVLETILMEEKGILLTELLEKTGGSPSPVQTLVKKGVLHLEQVRVDRSPLSDQEYFKTEAKKLNEQQAAALQRVVETLEKKRFETHLLFGVTGSGKTEVYLQAIDRALKMGLSALMLVPEISLTAQTIERFRSRFDNSIAILHHRLSEGERFDEWHRIRRGEARIVIGARSALFSPVQKLGLIIVDEEHDRAYKETEKQPCYNARDLSVVRGMLASAAVILGTATPSLESYYNAKIGKYRLSKLDCRASASTLPAVKIIDMRREFEKAGGYTNFSEALIEGIKKRLELGEQTLLFLNRRGYHTSLFCGPCGHIFTCPHCDLPLTFHRSEAILACHLCDHRLSPPPKECPSCHSQETLKYRGVGTEQVERALHALFPEARTLRVDGDTTRHKGSHERLFRAFSTGKADILIGTQMVTKGLHFPTVTLVAVLNGDGSLHIPDFRASENVFQLITQVAGRAGRGELPGEVIIQTQMPENLTIRQAAKQDYEEFYLTEAATREAFGFPPFSRLTKLTFSGTDAALTEQTANQVRSVLIKGLGKNYLIHPVVACGYAKIKDSYRFQCLIRGKHAAPAAVIRELAGIPRQVKMHIDIDPLSTFF